MDEYEKCKQNCTDPYYDCYAHDDSYPAKVNCSCKYNCITQPPQVSYNPVGNTELPHISPEILKFIGFFACFVLLPGIILILICLRKKEPQKVYNEVSTEVVVEQRNDIIELLPEGSANDTEIQDSEPITSEEREDE